MNKDQLDHLKDEVTQVVADNMGLNTDVMNGKGTLMGRALLVVQSLIRTKKETSPLPPLVALSQFMEKTVTHMYFSKKAIARTILSQLLTVTVFLMKVINCLLPEITGGI